MVLIAYLIAGTASCRAPKSGVGYCTTESQKHGGEKENEGFSLCLCGAITFPMHARGKLGEGQTRRIFSTRTKECNCHHGNHFGTLRGDAIIAQLTLSSAKI